VQLVTGDLWGELGKAQLLLVTTNSTLSYRGGLVMGAGVARQARDRFPELPGIFADQCWQFGFPRYGVLPGAVYGGTRVGAFQTKLHWRDPSPLDLIAESTAKLAAWIQRFDHGQRVALAFPGIGHGSLRVDQVLPIIESLPDNVYVYRKEQQ
jgi:hypothetical protein